MVEVACITPLFVPGDRPERFAKAAAAGTDAVIIDLEDAVAPDNKAAARNAICQPGALPQGVDIFVRINDCQTPWFHDDITAVAKLQVTGILLPKSNSAADIREVLQHSPGSQVIALIETACGLAAAREIAQAAGMARLAFGSIDLCADLGIGHTRQALLAARSEIVLASRLAGLFAPIDGVTTAIDNTELIEDDARYARELGFRGKLCIHPRQLMPARRGFSPSADEISWAQRILAAGPHGAISVDGKMVDAPVRAQAQRILAFAAVAV